MKIDLDKKILIVCNSDQIINTIHNEDRLRQKNITSLRY
jgi:hypothetical protein